MTRIQQIPNKLALSIHYLCVILEFMDSAFSFHPMRTDARVAFNSQHATSEATFGHQVNLRRIRRRIGFGSTDIFHGLNFDEALPNDLILGKSTATRMNDGNKMANEIIEKCDGIVYINQSSSHSLENFLPEVDIEGTIRPENRFPRLQSILSSPPISYSNQIVNNILYQLKSIGFIDDNELVLFAKDFLSSSSSPSSLSSQRSEMVSHVLIHDFGWKALDAHRARVGIVSLVKQHFGQTALDEYGLEGSGEDSFNNPQTEHLHKDSGGLGSLEKTMFGGNDKQMKTKLNSDKRESLSKLQPCTSSHALHHESKSFPPDKGTTPSISPQPDSEAGKPLSWKSVLVNDKAKLRRRKTLNDRSSGTNAHENKTYNYGLLQASQTNGNGANKHDTTTNDEQIYSNLFAELDSFWEFMTVPQTSSVAESPIRERTAEVYMRHARLFLGWIVDARGVLLEKDLLDKVLCDGSGDSGKRGKVTADSSSPPNVGSPSSLAQTSFKSSSAIKVRKQIWERARDRLEQCNGLSVDLGDEERVAKQKEEMTSRVSLYDIFPDSNVESTASILQYILWMR